MYTLERNRAMKLLLGAGSLDVAGTQPELWTGPSALGSALLRHFLTPDYNLLCEWN